MKKFSKSDKLRYLDVHTVGRQFCIGTFEHGYTHQIQFCNTLVLRKFILVTDGLDIFADIHVWSDFCMIKSSHSSMFRNKEILY